ncbi:MAG TPA: ClpXP protease specificity-enhancing factor [Burkholderiales bacterium]|nr:ClpXP protease specificity-enhancing factor [Burkholderiales bacterium]
MAALKTHLLRAVYDWAVENGHTPHIIVDANYAGVHVPTGYADATGRVVLNIGPNALRNFQFDDQWIRFSARFGGTPFNVETPLDAVLAIYAKENGQGISFPVESGDGPGDDGDGAPDSDNDATARKRPTLKVVK